MPGGRGGPHRISGVGFWAQQKFYNIFSVDSGPFIFRPPLKGLPDQPFPPNAFQSWTYSYNLNLIGTDKFPTGEQFWERPPLGPIPAENLKTWTSSYNLNLRGKDQLPVGDQVTELVPRPVQRLTDYTWLQSTTALGFPVPPVTNAIFRDYFRGLPEQPPQPLLQQSTFAAYAALYTITAALPVPLAKQITDLPQQPWRLDQTWTQSYNLNLIGRDVLLVGEQIYDLAPSQRPPEQIQLHSWAWSYNLSLVGKDRLPAGEQITELTLGQRPPEQIQLHSWSWSYNLNLRGRDVLPTGEQISDLPPRDPRDVRTWSWFYNVNLIGQDKLPVGEQIYDRPILPIAPALTWIEGPQYELIAKPFAQYDWPNAAPAYRLEQTWTASYNKNLIGQDVLPSGEQSTELVPRDFMRLLQTWIQQTNLALLTAPPDLTKQVHLFDYPNPRGAEPDWRRSWEWSYNKNLIGQDQLPIRQSDWPNPQRVVDRAADWIAQTNLALTAVQKPFIQTDWPNPQTPSRLDQSWSASYNKNLIGQDVLPFRQSDWPLTAAAPALPRAVDWIQHAITSIQTPFAQSDWPLPRAPAQGAQSWTASYNLNLIGQDQLPIGAATLVLPPQGSAPQLQTWLNAVDLALTQFTPPVRQRDWPNPTAFARDPTLGTITASYNLNLIALDALPVRQQDWPNPTQFARDPTLPFVGPSNPNLYPPTPVIVGGTLIVHVPSFVWPSYSDGRVPQ